MFAATGYGAGYGAARARYHEVDVASQVEGASPHRLIAILFEELTKILDILAASLGEGRSRAGVPERRARANSILGGLEASLDHAQGGELARGLASVYREARRLIDAGVTGNDPDRIIEARAMIGEIAEAWARIG